MAIRIDDIELGITHDSKDAVHSVEELENALKRLKTSFGSFGNKAPTSGITTLTNAIKGLSSLLGGDIVSKITSFNASLNTIAETSLKAVPAIDKLAKEIKKIGSMEIGTGAANVANSVTELANSVNELDATKVTELANALKSLKSMVNSYANLATKIEETDLTSGFSTAAEGIRLISESTEGVDTDKAERLAEMMRAMKSALSAFGNEKLTTGVDGLTRAMTAITSIRFDDKFISDIDRLSTSIEKLSVAYERLAKAQKGAKLRSPTGGKAEKVKPEVTTDEVKVETDSGASGSWIGKLRDKISLLTREARKAKTEVNKIGKDSEKAGKRGASAFGKLFSSIKRIAMYRLIRSAFAAIGKSIKEGTQNLYQWSKLQKDTTGNKFAQSMDKAASSLLYLKNGIGAAIAPLIEALIPALEKIVNKVVDFVNKISELNAALNGESTFVKAKYLDIEYGAEDATKANEKLKKSLLGFDEINALSDNSSSSDSKDAAKDYSKMFETAKTQMKIPSWVTDFTSDLSALATDLTLEFKDVFLKWDNLTGEDIAKKVVAGIITLLAGVTGIAVTGSLSGGLVFALGGVLLSLIADKVIFDDNGKLTADEVVKMIIPVLTGICGAIIGWKIGGPQGLLVGALAGIGLGLVFDAVSFDKDGKLSGEEISKLVFQLVSGIIGGVIGAVVTRSPTGFAIGFTAGMTISVIAAEIIGDENWEKVSNWFSDLNVKRKTFELAVLIIADKVVNWVLEKLSEAGDWAKSLKITVIDSIGETAKKIINWWNEHFGDKDDETGTLKVNAKGNEDGIFSGIKKWWGEHFADEGKEEGSLTLSAIASIGQFWDNVVNFWNKLTGRDAQNTATATVKATGTTDKLFDSISAFWNKIFGKDGDKKTVTANLKGTEDDNGGKLRSFWSGLKSGTTKSAKVGLSWTDKSSSIRTWFSNRTKGTSAPVTAKWKDKAADNPVRKWFSEKISGISAKVKAKWTDKAEDNPVRKWFAEKKKGIIAKVKSAFDLTDEKSNDTIATIDSWKLGITTKVSTAWEKGKTAVKDWIDNAKSIAITAGVTMSNAAEKLFKQAVSSIVETVNKAIKLINKIKPGNDLKELKNPFPEFATYATGGFPTYGSMFIAGEAGAELVGTINGRTGVASQGEITGIADAVRESSDREARLLTALIGAVESSGNGEVVISTSSLTNALARNNRRMGRTVSAVGT